MMKVNYDLPIRIEKQVSALRVKLLFWDWVEQKGFLVDEPEIGLYFDRKPEHFKKYINNRIDNLYRWYGIKRI